MTRSTTPRLTSCSVGLGRLSAGSAAVPVSDRSYRLSLAEPGTSRRRLIEPLRVQRLADLGHQLGLPLP